MDLLSLKDTVPISVAIPAFGNEAALTYTLARIFQSSPLPQEVLLHFDGGWEPATDFTADAPVPVRIFRSATNLGPGGGRHRLLHEAHCELVACFDDDSWPLDADYFARVLALMTVFPNVAVMSPAVYLKEKPILPTIAEASESVGFEGSASVTRRSMYLQLPGYVPVPKPYGVEETDLSLQAHAAGFEILSSPWLRAWHNRPHADNQHGTAPWVANEVLMAYLRYPRWLQPWGWLRALRRIKLHWAPHNTRWLLGALASSPQLCLTYEGYCRRYGIREIWAHHFSPRQRWLLGDLERPGPGEASVAITPAPPLKRALYIQYTNPAGYPPLEHSSQILARAGWQVEFLGIQGRIQPALKFPAHPRITVRRMSWCEPGWRQKVHYFAFTARALWRSLRFRPHWLYASDLLSATPARLVRMITGCKIVYHEHDSPTALSTQANLFIRAIAGDRQALASGAEAVVLPNQQRLAAFVQEFRPSGRVFCVWNCPSVDDVPPPREARPGSQPLIVLYHGSIVPDRFPLTKLQALAQCGRNIRLRLIGYETQGFHGYTDVLKAEAERLGISDRFEYLGTLQRADLLKSCAECDVGLSMLRIHDGDINMRHMTGASNKPFDYLSQGLALIVPDDPEWRRMYVDYGCAMACEQGSVDALAKLLAWMDDHRDEVRRMGQTGQRLVAQAWNYEAQFQPVRELMEAPEE